MKLFLVPRFKDASGISDSLLVWSIDREDYKTLTSAYKEKLGWSFDNLKISGFNGYKPAIKLTTYLYFISIIPKLVKNGSSLKELSIILYSVIHSINSYNELKSLPNLATYEKIIAFNSSFHYESLLILLCRQREKTTFSLQHGMYLKFSNSPPFDMITMYYCHAHYLLAWGKFTADQLSDHLQPFTQIIVTGHPIYSGIERTRYKKLVINKKILVLLPRNTYAAEVRELISILTDRNFRNYRLTIRPHPSIKSRVQEQIRQLENAVVSENSTLIQDLNKEWECIIGFNSTSLFESLLYGNTVLQYQSGNDEFESVGFTEFSDKASLTTILQNLEKTKQRVDPTYYFGCKFADLDPTTLTKSTQSNTYPHC